MGVVSLSEMTNMVKESIIQEAVAMQSVSTLAETSTRAATDTYEDRLPTSDTFLDSSGNPKRTSQNALATVVGGLIGTATPSKDGLIPRELMPIPVDTTDSKYIFLLASFSANNKFIATFVISVNKTQYVEPYSYIVSFSYNPSYGLSNALNTNGKYSKGATPFYYKQTSNTIQLFISTETYCPIDIIPLSVTGGKITFEESSESTSNLTRF